MHKIKCILSSLTDCVWCSFLRVFFTVLWISKKKKSCCYPLCVGNRAGRWGQWLTWNDSQTSDHDYLYLFGASSQVYDGR